MTSELPAGTAAVLDSRFPIDTTTQHAPLYDALLAEWWHDHPGFTADERCRAAYQAGVQSVVAAHGGERRYMRPLEETSPWQLPDDWYKPPPYPQLAERELAHEWDTGSATAIEAVVEEPKRHRRRGPGGRFISHKTATGGAM